MKLISLSLSALPEGIGSAGEHPQHEVTISQRFAISRYAVTFEEWDAYVVETDGYKPIAEGWGHERRPVIKVSWKDVQAYIKWLNDKIGYIYRLPSEAEWEYACRSNSQPGDKYHFGSDEKQLGDYAWFSDNSNGSTHPVGEKEPSQFGLYDMHGNVWEWCADHYHDSYNGAPDDGSVWLQGEHASDNRVLRGGSWYIFPTGLRSASRSRDRPGGRGNDNGFRVARSLPLPRSLRIIP
ncbi:MAG: formylglycine-generating enzyme family protein [bacterium]|nr:formylglycine-generating enzyme family protein [bacterium]